MTGIGDVLQQIREGEEQIERSGELTYAAFHNQLNADIALARQLGIPEPVVQAEARRVDIAYTDELERILQHRKNNLHRDRWRAFKAQHLNKHPLCGRCVREGKWGFATELRHLVVHAGDPEKMFNPLLVEGVCHAHFFGSRYRTITDGVDG